MTMTTHGKCAWKVGDRSEVSGCDCNCLVTIAHEIMHGDEKGRVVKDFCC